MDCGGFYRGGNSVSTSFSDAPGYMTSLSSTPNNSFNSFGFCPSPVATDSITHSGSANQKLDQLLFLFNEQKAQNGELRKEVSALKEQVSELFKKQAVVQDSVVNVVSRKKTVKLPPEVSLTVKHLHDNSPDTLKFNGEEIYTSEKNREVKDYLLEQVKTKYENVVGVSPRRLRKAVHRYYESRRRLFNDERPGRKQKATAVRLKCKRANYQKKLYNNRKKYLKKEKEVAMWSKIDFEYMTEESEGEFDDKILQHKLPWRSQALNKLVRRLDKRLEKQSRGGTFKRKERILSSWSIAEPPEDAPSWAVDTSQTSAHDEL